MAGMQQSMLMGMCLREVTSFNWEVLRVNTAQAVRCSYLCVETLIAECQLGEAPAPD